MSRRPLNEHLAHLVAQANRHIHRQLTAEGVSLDQWRLMMALSESGGLTMGKLAEELAEVHPGRSGVPADAREQFARVQGIHCITPRQPAACA
jgi:hypothetical protein